MEEKAWEHFMTSGSVYDYLEYRGVLGGSEIRTENSREKECNGRNNGDRHGVSSHAGRGL